MPGTAQFLVIEGLHLLDQTGFEQQGSDLTGRANVADAQCLAQHAGFVRVAQVRENTIANIDALANVERQQVRLPMKGINTRRAGKIIHGLAQMLGVLKFDFGVEFRMTFAVGSHANKGMSGPCSDGNPERTRFSIWTSIAMVDAFASGAAGGIDNLFIHTVYFDAGRLVMCSHYQGVKDRERYEKYFCTQPPAETGKVDMWPGYQGSFIRRHPNADAGDDAVPQGEALNGLFGLVAHWATDLKMTRSTYNARSETVADKPSFRDAWRRGQCCIIAAEAMYEPDWRSGRAAATCIQRTDGSPMGIAGLWSQWKSPQGELVYSYTMLTINADAHDLMKQFHKPGDEKRMVVILPEDRYLAWLHSGLTNRMDFMRPFPSDQLFTSVTTPYTPTLL